MFTHRKYEYVIDRSVKYMIKNISYISFETRFLLLWSVPGKLHGSDGHSKRKCLQDRANFHRSRAWQIVLMLNTIMTSTHWSKCWCKGDAESWIIWDSQTEVLEGAVIPPQCWLIPQLPRAPSQTGRQLHLSLLRGLLLAGYPTSQTFCSGVSCVENVCIFSTDLGYIHQQNLVPFTNNFLKP